MKFHTWGAEFRDNKATDDDEPIFVASDASLDEGAIIRTTAPSGSPLAGPVQYFLGLDRGEAEIVLNALDHWSNIVRDGDAEGDADEVDSLFARAHRLYGYTGGEV